MNLFKGFWLWFVGDEDHQRRNKSYNKNTTSVNSQQSFNVEENQHKIDDFDLCDADEFYND